jgi:transcriptional regulator with XRE-family HTH domain
MEKTITGLDFVIDATEEERKELAQKEFAQEIRRLRNKAGLSQKRLGALIGVEQTIMARIEKGTHGVTLDLVLRFARAFNDDPHRLANIYWGIGSTEYIDANKRILDSIWDLIYPHYQPKVIMPPQLPPSDQPEQPLNAEQLGEIESADQLHEKKKPSRKPKTIENKVEEQDNDT